MSANVIIKQDSFFELQSEAKWYYKIQWASDVHWTFDVHWEGRYYKVG